MSGLFEQALFKQCIQDIDDDILISRDKIDKAQASIDKAQKVQKGNWKIKIEHKNEIIKLEREKIVEMYKKKNHLVKYFKSAWLAEFDTRESNKT